MVDINYVVGLGIALFLESVIFVLYAMDVKFNYLLLGIKSEGYKTDYEHEQQSHLDTLAKTDELRDRVSRFETFYESIDQACVALEEGREV